MLAVAILSNDSTLRDALEQIIRDDRSLSLVRSADTPATLLRFAEINRIDVLLAAPQRGGHFDWSSTQPI